MKKINYQNIVKHLLKKIPEFKRIYEQHLKNQRGKVLLHVLFGDFTRFVIKQFSNLQENENAKDIFLRCVEFIEELLQQNNVEINNLVGASFLENLHQPNNYYGLIKLMKPYFGPKTLELLKSMMRDDKHNA